MSDVMPFTLRLTNGQTYGPADLVTIEQWARQGRVPRDAVLVPDGAEEGEPVLNRPELARILNAPPTVQGETSTTGRDNGMSRLIPYRNTPALLAYYFGVFSLLPLIGVLLAIPAVILGVIGLRKRRAEPRVGGAVHAWVGIIAGALLTMLWTAGIVITIVGLQMS